MTRISADYPFDPHFIEADGVRMHYVDTGPKDGPVVLFLHGNPTWSYLWRNVIPPVATAGARCIAPDLVGFGRSDKPATGLRFEEQSRYVDAFIRAMNLDRVTLVLHDWGSAIGLDWARRHEDRVDGLALMEFIQPVPAWSDWPEGIRPIFQAFRTPSQNGPLIVEQNVFIEKVLPGAVSRGLTDAEMAQYRAPFEDPRSRVCIARFPTELPIEGHPADVVARVKLYMEWLDRTIIPKRLFYGSPGILVTPEAAARYARSWPNVRTVDIGPGLHYVQEDNPDAIGKGVAALVFRK